MHRDLTHTERMVYEAARAEALADRWRIDADIRERRGEPAGLAREYQRMREAEAAERWAALATLEGEPAVA